MSAGYFFLFGGHIGNDTLFISFSREDLICVPKSAYCDLHPLFLVQIGVSLGNEICLYSAEKESCVHNQSHNLANTFDWFYHFSLLTL